MAPDESRTQDAQTPGPQSAAGLGWNALSSPLDPPSQDHRGRLPWREGLLIFVLALTLNLLGNGWISLWDRDEPRYAACAREMWTNSDYLFPTFNAEPRYHKPVLVYWLMQVGRLAGGDNPFGARFVSSIMGAGTCLLIWGLGRRMLGPWAGFWSALVLATAPIMVAESKLSTTDATLTFFLVGCWFCLWELSRRDSKALTLVFWVSLALATLTKGPVGPGLIVGSVVVSWWWGGPTAFLRRLRWAWGVPLFFLITAPWYIAIGILSDGEFYRVSMGYHVIRRMTTGIEQHGHFPGYYLLGSLVTFYPWSALVPAAVLALWRFRKQTPVAGFLMGWVIGPLIMFELIRTKLIHYFLPAYPGCALMVGWLIEAVARDEVNLRRWPLGRLAVGLLGGIGLTVVVVMLAGGVVLPSTMRLPSVVLGVVLAVGTVWAMNQFSTAQTRRAAATLAFTWCLMLAGLTGWFLPAAEPYRISNRVGTRLAELEKELGIPPALGIFEPPAVVYGVGHPVPVLRGKAKWLDHVTSKGPALAALYDTEIEVLSRVPQLRVEPMETISGFNHDKFRTETLRFVVVRPAVPGEVARSVEPARR